MLKNKQNLSQIGLGTWPFGGDNWSHGWGYQDELITINLIIECLKNDIKLIDTAPAYGHGKAEELIGASLIRWRGAKPVIATKCGQQLRIDGRGFITNHTKKSIRNEIISSMERLKVECLDLVFLHYPSKNSYENLEALEELDTLRMEGKIKSIGLSNFDYEQIFNIVKYFKISAIQLKYSMINRSYDMAAIKFYKTKNIQIYGYQPLESGLLTGTFFHEAGRSIPLSDWRSRSSLFNENSITNLGHLNQFLAQLAYRFDVSIATVSLAWTLQSSFCDVTLVGVRNMEQLSQLLKYKNVLLTQNDLNTINNLSQIPFKKPSL
jgi:aryl-alcohol dehydrogenase-like predicted oxidoreductase